MAWARPHVTVDAGGDVEHNGRGRPLWKVNLMPTLMPQSLIVSVTRLDPADAKRVWEFLGKFMDNPAHPSLSLERITQAVDKKLWSGRISQGLRAVIHRDGNLNTILYARSEERRVGNEWGARWATRQ